LRRLLDALYAASAWLAALFLIALLVMVLLGILGRHWGFYIRGTDAYAGYLMAGAGFLALAHTLKRGEHIRVSLLLRRLRPSARHRLELVVLAIGFVLVLLLAFFSGKLVWQSWQFHDISTGNDATPLWIPQLGMAIGTTILAIALLDEWWREWRGERQPEPEQLRE
jgi:TRAP-type C4-dicarboxylate transport system, small permease component